MRRGPGHLSAPLLEVTYRPARSREVVVQHLEPRAEVLPAQAQPEVRVAVAVHGRRQQAALRSARAPARRRPPRRPRPPLSRTPSRGKQTVPACGGTQLKTSAVALEEVRGRAPVPLDAGKVGREDAVPLAQRHQGQQLAGRAAADGRVVLEALDPLEQRLVTGRHPADAQPGQPERLRHAGQRHRSFVEVDGRRQAQLGRRLQQPVHLVGEQPGSRVRRQRPPCG